MRPHARAGLAATAVGAVLAASALPALAAPPSSATSTGGATAGATTPAPAAAEPVTVTLLTGDVVHLTTTPSGKAAVTVEAAPGATGPVQTMQVGEDLYVVPDAAQPYLASGALDQALFNVTDLVEDGYDDASSGGIPVIAQYDRRLRATPAPLAGSEKALDLPSIGGAALVADTDEAAEFWGALTAPSRARSAGKPGTFAGGVAKLWLDGRVEATLDVSVPLVGAPEAWASGHDGTGATVAVLDTGIDAAHPDLVDVVTQTQSFVPGETVTDVHGHGTHVASTVAGSGAASGGANKGVAPGADVAVGKVLGDDGYGQDSWIIAGMEWAARTADADVVSMSLGDDSRHDQTDPIAQSLNALTAETDALFVVAAGNAGRTGSVSSPGTADAALTVAATDDRDRLATFSSRGPRGLDDGLKPDLAAPGVGITAARSQFSSGSGSYKSMNGTSMATPHVSGAAAILAAAHPEWGAQRIKDALMSSSKPLDYTLYEVGSGRLDVPASLEGVDATGSVYFGKVAWGDADPEPQTRTITYSNDTDADVELDLAATTDGPDGAVDLVTLSADHVVVPAHGSASVDATASFGVAPTTGHYLGAVVATDATGAVVARTGTGLTREEERYDVDVTVLGPDGEPVPAQVTFYQYGTTNVSQLVTDAATGTTPAQRVVPGVYAATASVRFADTDGTDRTYLLTAPHVAVTDGDQHVVLDARDASEVELDTPRPSDDLSGRVEWFHDSGVGGEYATFYVSMATTPGAEVWANETGDVPGGQFAFTSRWSRTASLLDLEARTSRTVKLDPLYQRGSARLDGKVRLDAVVAGTGTAEELAAVDAESKAVVVTNSAAVDPVARAQVAADAGAALLVVVNDGPGVLYDPAGGTNLPVVSLPAEQGAALLAGSATLRGSATEFGDYAYEIAHTWSGAVPGDLTVAPRERELARVTDRLVDPDPRVAFVTRYDCPDYLRSCLGGPQPRMTGSELDTYVSTVDSPSWYTDIYSTNGWSVRDDTRAYRPGERTTIDWFGVVAPHQGPGFWQSTANGRFFRLNVPYASSSGDLTGTFGDRATVVSRLFQDDTLVREGASQAFQGTVPAASGAHRYRFEMDTAVDPAVWPYSTRTSTAWEFAWDQAQSTALVPIISVGYDAPTDLSGEVSARRGTEIAVTARHEDGAVGAGAITGVDVELSYDEGETWEPARTRGDGDGRWTVRLDPPRHASSVSLRTTAADDAGNSVTQEVVKAFGLR
ncbi:S8 family serine peptidase [Isoptericola hypogeus]|uniref:S8 family serine peptidase n=1 Tax=Isoptericola hypogeus TaxID=300179 RepID=A0ABP4VI95_9MICO